MTDWHSLSTDETFAALDSSAAGLTRAQASERLKRFGRNELPEAPPRQWLRLLLAQLTDFMVLLLLAAALISAFVGDWLDSAIIGALVVLNAAFGVAQEYRAERAMRALKAMAAPNARVVRDGVETTVPASDLAPGDVVLLEAGVIAPADLRVVHAASLRMNEAALTGESAPIDKSAAAHCDVKASVSERVNMVFKGTHVTYGRGVGVVVATGLHTEFGRIAQLLQQATPTATPLQRRLAQFGRRLTAIVLAICIVVFAIGWLRHEPLLPLFMTAVSLAVAALPEALPAVVTIALALGARRMTKQRALIRRLPAVETLGSVTYICADKTGTLTENRMRVAQFFCAGERVDAPRATPPWRELLRAIGVSHDAHAAHDGELIGDPTETALLAAALDAGLQHDELTAALPRADEIPFDAERKRMTTLHRDNGDYLAITKGAPEAVLARCTRMLSAHGAVPLDLDAIEQTTQAMAGDGMRVLAIAVRRWTQHPEPMSIEHVERELTLLGLVGLLDPPRAEALEAVRDCKRAGIVPVMITGDHPRTAQAIARKLEIADADDAVLTGRELAELSDEQLLQRLQRVRVFARIAPEQKLRIVSLLQARGECVAMTGDGVNDAPALRKADIGVAMGVTGADVAKEASAMTLLDDNFATIVRAVREGRRIYDNLRRFVRYVLTTNSAEIWLIFLAPFVGLPIPLLPIQILWINLVTDGLPGLALAAERAEPDVMRRPPYPPSEDILARGLGLQALWTGLGMAALLLAAQAWAIYAHSPHWRTLVFDALCFSQLAYVLAIRSERRSLFALHAFSNPLLMLAIALTVVAQLALTYVPSLQPLFKTESLTIGELGVTFLIALLVLAAVELEKLLRRRRVADRQSEAV